MSTMNDPIMQKENVMYSDDTLNRLPPPSTTTNWLLEYNYISLKAKCQNAYKRAILRQKSQNSIILQVI